MGSPQPFDEATPAPALPRGTRVEVRTKFEGAWAAGFEVVEEERQGVRVRRRSDGYEIPRTFTGEDVRPHER